MRDMLSDRDDFGFRPWLLAVLRLIELRHPVRVMRSGPERRVVAIAPAVAQFVEINARLLQSFTQLAFVLWDQFRPSEMLHQSAVGSRFGFGGVFDQASGDREIVRSPFLLLILESHIRPTASDSDGISVPLDPELEPIRIA